MTRWIKQAAFGAVVGLLGCGPEMANDEGGEPLEGPRELAQGSRGCQVLPFTMSSAPPEDGTISGYVGSKFSSCVYRNVNTGGPGGTEVLSNTFGPAIQFAGSFFHSAGYWMVHYYPDGSSRQSDGRITHVSSECYPDGSKASRYDIVRASGTTVTVTCASTLTMRNEDPMTKTWSMQCSNGFELTCKHTSADAGQL